MSPTAKPSKAPTISPTTAHPSPSPTESGVPTLIEFYEVTLPDFELQLVISKASRRNLVEVVSHTSIFNAIEVLLSSAYGNAYSDFYVLDLSVDDPVERDETDKTTVIFPFKLGCVFTSDNPATIPSESELTSVTVRALVGEDATTLFNNASDETFSSIAINKVASNQIVSNNNPGITVTEEKATSKTTLSLTITAAVVAVFSTLTALGLIYAQRRKMEEEIATSSSKPANEDTSPKTIRKIRSPFALTATPADGTRKYFCRLDDESISSRSQNNPYLNPDVSVVNSSFSRDEESSLEAPSMTGLSSVCGDSKAGESMQSLDGESYANMSALDEVRLGNVLDLEGSFVEDHSLATVSDSGSKLERKSTFAKLWYGRRKQKASNNSSPQKFSETSMLSPPSSKISPIDPFVGAPSLDSADDQSAGETESVLEQKDADDNSLLGNQSDKGTYYGQNNEASPFFSMLGDRSVNSMESDSVDFNDMYAADHSSFDESSTGGSSRMSSAISSSVHARLAGN